MLIKHRHTPAAQHNRARRRTLMRFWGQSKLIIFIFYHRNCCFLVFFIVVVASLCCYKIRFLFFSGNSIYFQFRLFYDIHRNQSQHILHTWVSNTAHHPIITFCSPKNTQKTNAPSSSYQHAPNASTWNQLTSTNICWFNKFYQLFSLSVMALFSRFLVTIFRRKLEVSKKFLFKKGVSYIYLFLAPL